MANRVARAAFTRDVNAFLQVGTTSANTSGHRQAEVWDRYRELMRSGAATEGQLAQTRAKLLKVWGIDPRIIKNTDCVGFTAEGRAIFMPGFYDDPNEDAVPSGVEFVRPLQALRQRGTVGVPQHSTTSENKPQNLTTRVQNLTTRIRAFEAGAKGVTLHSPHSEQFSDKLAALLEEARQLLATTSPELIDVAIFDAISRMEKYTKHEVTLRKLRIYRNTDIDLEDDSVGTIAVGMLRIAQVLTPETLAIVQRDLCVCSLKCDRQKTKGDKTDSAVISLAIGVALRTVSEKVSFIPRPAPLSLNLPIGAKSLGKDVTAAGSSSPYVITSDSNNQHDGSASPELMRGIAVQLADGWDVALPWAIELPLRPMH